MIVILKAKYKRKNSTNSIDTDKSYYELSPKPNLIVLNRPVESELVAYLQAKNTVDIGIQTNDPSFGNTKGSLYKLFQDKHSSIKSVAKNLTEILMEAFKSEVYLQDSFFSIFGAGGGTAPHVHLNEYDKIPGLDLDKQKHSLVYYLSVGDQACKDPGILKLYDPVDEILPEEGMITIFPATRPHSSLYGGKTNRIIIGINFYTI